MKNVIFIWLFIIPLNCFAQNNLTSRLFTKQELKEDLDFLFSSLENIHPDLYYYTSKEEIEKRRHKLENELPDETSRLEFAKKLVPIISSLGDGHTYLNMPIEVLQNVWYEKSVLFPFGIIIDNNRIFITTNYSSDSTIQKFSEIVSINDFSSKEIIQRLRKYISAELDFYRDIRVQRSFRNLLWYEFGFEEFNLKMVYNNKDISCFVNGITRTELEQVYEKKFKNITYKPFSFYTIDDSTGVINFQSMSNLKGFKRFLKSTFEQIKKDNIKYLIIDVRNNGGGSSRLANALFDYISFEPYKMAEKMEVKASKETSKYIKKRHLKWFMYPIYPLFYLSKQARPYFFNKPGNLSSK